MRIVVVSVPARLQYVPPTGVSTPGQVETTTSFDFTPEPVLATLKLSRWAKPEGTVILNAVICWGGTVLMSRGQAEVMLPVSITTVFAGRAPQASVGGGALQLASTGVTAPLTFMVPSVQTEPSSMVM